LDGGGAAATWKLRMNVPTVTVPMLPTPTVGLDGDVRCVFGRHRQHLGPL
jgi:hypothetical protein